MLNLNDFEICIFFDCLFWINGCFRVGIEIPKIEVRYEKLSVEGDVHVGSRALPTLFNVALNSIEVLLLFLYF